MISDELKQIKISMGKRTRVSWQRQMYQRLDKRTATRHIRP